jgi:hypothetical protein
MATQETKDNLQELVTRAERINDIVIQTLENLKSETRDMSKSLPRLTFEIEELKKIRDTLLSSLSEKMKEVYTEQNKTLHKQIMDVLVVDAELKVRMKEISKEFRDLIQQEKADLKRELDKHAAQAKEINEKYREGADKFTKDMEGTVSTLKQLLNLQKQRLTRKGLLICGVFCLASVLSGAGIFYFFPQNIYYSDPNVARYMMMGRATWENMKHLSVKDQNMLLDGMKKYMAKK